MPVPPSDEPSKVGIAHPCASCRRPTTVSAAFQPSTCGSWRSMARYTTIISCNLWGAISDVIVNNPDGLTWHHQHHMTLSLGLAVTGGGPVTEVKYASSSPKVGYSQTVVAPSLCGQGRYCFETKGTRRIIPIPNTIDPPSQRYITTIYSKCPESTDNCY